MSDGVRVFVNEHAVVVLGGATIREAVVAFDPAQGEIRRFRTDQQAHDVAAAEAALAAVDPKFASNQKVSNASLEDICK